jgi:hypothetical protein
MTELTPPDAAQTALQRLAASRDRLRAALLPRTADGGGGGVQGDRPHAARGLFKRLRAVLRAAPAHSAGRAAFDLLAREARRWWTRQPWHASAEVLGQAAIDSIGPLVRRHPAAAVAIAAAAGAALASVRPWRWRAVSTRVEPMGRQFGAWAWQQVQQAPVQVALASALAAWLNGQRGAATTAAAAAPAPSANNDGAAADSATELDTTTADTSHAAARDTVRPEASKPIDSLMARSG